VTERSATVEACPNCDGTRYRKRTTKSPTYKCVCGETFDEPTRRKNKNRTSPWKDNEPALPVNEVREAIREREYSHVTTTPLTTDVDARPQAIGLALTKLGETGELEIWRETHDHTTWTVVDVRDPEGT